MKVFVLRRTLRSLLKKRTARSIGLLILMGLAAFLLISSGRGSASALPAPADSGKPNVSLQTTYYDIDGSTVRELNSQMHRLGPVDKTGRHNDAFTEWDIRWTFRCKGRSGNISVDSFDVNLKVKFTYPRWQPSSNAAQELVKKWKAYTTALQAHESKHKDIAIEAADEVVASIKELGSYASCQELGSAVNAAGQGVLQAARETETDYDEETDHGLTEGARLR